MGYIIHSAKGTTWSNHKYVKKVGDKYIYPDGKSNVDTSKENDEEKAVDLDDTSKEKSIKAKKSSEIDRIKALTNQVLSGKIDRNDLRKGNNGKDYMDVMNAVNAKFKKPGSSGSGKSEKKKEDNKTDKKEAAKKTTEKEEKQTTSKVKAAEQNQPSKIEETKPKAEEEKTESKESTATEVSESIKTSVKSVATIHDDDSIYATKNEDGTTTVRVDFNDGTTQTFILSQTFDVVSKSEKTKRGLTHTTFKGNSYLIHRMV